MKEREHVTDDEIMKVADILMGSPEAAKHRASIITLVRSGIGADRQAVSEAYAKTRNRLRTTSVEDFIKNGGVT